MSKDDINIADRGIHGGPKAMRKRKGLVMNVAKKADPKSARSKRRENRNFRDTDDHRPVRRAKARLAKRVKDFKDGSHVTKPGSLKLR